MTRIRKLVGSRCYLSPCIPEDAEVWHRWLHDPRIALLSGRAAFDPPTPESLRRVVEHSCGPQTHVFTILTSEGDVPIGRCDIGDVDHTNRRGWVNILIGEPEITDRLRVTADSDLVAVWPPETETAFTGSNKRLLTFGTL